MKDVYADNNATTKVAPEVSDAMLPFFSDYYGNPSSSHTKGIEAERALKKARRTLAEYCGGDERDVIFTSGATESINLALRGVVDAHKRKGKHIVTSLVEHEAVLNTASALSDEGVEVSYITPDEYGRITPEQVVDAMRDDTILVAIMHVNNELGTIYPIEAIAHAIRQRNAMTLFFSDGAQAFGKLPVSGKIPDLYAISAHKLHGPKGVGALFVRNGVRLTSHHTGSGQEFGLRSGTENIPGIVGLAQATELAYENLHTCRTDLQTLRHRFVTGLKEIDSVRINSPDDALEITTSAAFPGIPGEVLLNALDAKGIYVSTGSACSSHHERRSHVIEALGLPDEVADSTLRFGFSRYTNMEEVEYILTVLKEVVPELRKTTQ